MSGRRMTAHVKAYTHDDSSLIPPGKVMLIADPPSFGEESSASQLEMETAADLWRLTLLPTAKPKPEEIQ